MAPCWPDGGATLCQTVEMQARIFVSSGECFTVNVPDGTDRECLALPKHADRFAFWRRKSGDKRIVGHTLVWEIA